MSLRFAVSTLAVWALGCAPRTGAVVHDLATTADAATVRDLAIVDLAAVDLRALLVVDLASPDLVPGPVLVDSPHWRLVFADEFSGKPGRASDAYCFDELLPQCHVWPGGNSHNCDLSDVAGAGFFPPLQPNLIASINLMEPGHDFTGLTDDDVKLLYAELVDTRLQSLDKCTWTLYEMVNWMATDYAGHWSARFDPSQVRVVPDGKGYLELSATYAPVAADCIYGGVLSGPNCQLWAAGAGELSQSVTYTVDAAGAVPGVYYAATSGMCPSGGTLSGDGTRCLVRSFAPGQFPQRLEESGVTYWVDANPAYPGVYYANQTYRCKDNIDYSPTLGFRNLTCPILDGAVMSHAFDNRGYLGQPRGEMQFRGRFEAKARIPKGLGSFPATWLMPSEGGWPYKGGEIDIMEARDNANEVYQTYHHGKCYSPADHSLVDAPDPNACVQMGGASTHLSLGYTAEERTTDEFWLRDHLFAVEWSDGKLIYSINNAVIGTVAVGSVGTLDNGAPASLATFEAANFPTSPFYWILNHSTYVPPDKVASFATQTFRIDYVRNYVACGTDNAEYCPCGGVFSETVVDGANCELHGAPLACPSGVSPPTVVMDRYPSTCQPSTRRCVNGGRSAGSKCIVHEFAPGSVESTISYWVDADPRWPGVYYHKIGNGCPYGGSGDVNCQLYGFPPGVLETGIEYKVDPLYDPPIVYYAQDFDYTP